MGLIGQLRADIRQLERVYDLPSEPGVLPKPGSDTSRAQLAKVALGHDGYKVLVFTRLREAARRSPIPGVNHLLRLAGSILFSVEVGNGVVIGTGTDFVHTLGTVVGGTSVLGERVRLLGNNTLGTAKGNGCPVIGDDVVIGCGARILGPVTVGAGAFIGANAVVVSDVPAGAVAVGIPATVHSQR